MRVSILLLVALFGAALIGAMLALPVTETLGAAAIAQSAATGVTHPITAVLLGFRAYDTLLEMVVVLLAVRIAVVDVDSDAPAASAKDPLSAALLRWLLPLILLVAAALLWAGSSRPGGAFQAGALAAAAGVALKLAGLWPHDALRAHHWRVLQTIGVVVFLLVGSASLLVGSPWLSLPAAWAGRAILVIESALTLSIAAGLLSLFAAAPAARHR